MANPSRKSTLTRSSASNKQTDSSSARKTYPPQQLGIGVVALLVLASLALAGDVLPNSTLTGAVIVSCCSLFFFLLGGGEIPRGNRR